MQDSPQIQQLKQRYRQSFPEKLSIIENIKQGIIESNSIDEAKSELHKLAGSSGMYGYPDLAQNCRDAMQKIDDGNTNQAISHIDSVILFLSSEG